MNEINGKIARLERELAQAYAEAGVPALSAEHPKLPEWWVNGRYSYQTIFNAIAAETRIKGAAIGISVAAFEQAMIAAAPQPDRVAELEAEVERLTQQMQFQRADFLALQNAIVGNTGASAIIEVERLRKDAERYQLLRRGQHWSAIDGIGNTLRADDLDKAIDAALAAKGEKPCE